MTNTQEPSHILLRKCYVLLTVKQKEAAPSFTHAEPITILHHFCNHQAAC